MASLVFVQHEKLAHHAPQYRLGPRRNCLTSRAGGGLSSVVRDAGRGDRRRSIAGAPSWREVVVVLREKTLRESMDIDG
ncbi:hypothetical protein RB195_005635 [Necator americanus]|uniref:Uncharacterized protein n=1 Tax=Necator americanus TaxID=51031 RepID=A0ABR1BQQ2_NECAM